MTKEQRLINTQKQFANLDTPKTYEQFILEEANLTNQQDLYPDLSYEDVSLSKGYGPCKWDNPNCSCSKAELERQAAELKVQREREALEYERRQREREEAERKEVEERKEAERKEAERKRKEAEERRKSQEPYSNNSNI